MRLIIHNFKSFKDTNTLDIVDQGFITLFGSAGSGKSTLLEAIMFVCGQIDTPACTDSSMYVQLDLHPTEHFKRTTQYCLINELVVDKDLYAAMVSRYLPMISISRDHWHDCFANPEKMATVISGYFERYVYESNGEVEALRQQLAEEVKLLDDTRVKVASTTGMLTEIRKFLRNLRVEPQNTKVRLSWNAATRADLIAELSSNHRQLMRARLYNSRKVLVDLEPTIESCKNMLKNTENDIAEAERALQRETERLGGLQAENKQNLNRSNDYVPPFKSFVKMKPVETVATAELFESNQTWYVVQTQHLWSKLEVNISNFLHECGEYHTKEQELEELRLRRAKAMAKFKTLAECQEIQIDGCREEKIPILAIVSELQFATGNESIHAAAYVLICEGVETNILKNQVSRTVLVPDRSTLVACMEYLRTSRQFSKIFPCIKFVLPSEYGPKAMPSCLETAFEGIQWLSSVIESKDAHYTGTLKKLFAEDILLPDNVDPQKVAEMTKFRLVNRQGYTFQHRDMSSIVCTDVASARATELNSERIMKMDYQIKHMDYSITALELSGSQLKAAIQMRLKEQSQIRDTLTRLSLMMRTNQFFDLQYSIVSLPFMMADNNLDLVNPDVNQDFALKQIQFTKDMTLVTEAIKKNQTLLENSRMKHTLIQASIEESQSKWELALLEFTDIETKAFCLLDREPLDSEDVLGLYNSMLEPIDTSIPTSKIISDLNARNVILENLLDQPMVAYNDAVQTRVDHLKERQSMLQDELSSQRMEEKMIQSRISKLKSSLRRYYSYITGTIEGQLTLWGGLLDGSQFGNDPIDLYLGVTECTNTVGITVEAVFGNSNIPVPGAVLSFSEQVLVVFAIQLALASGAYDNPMSLLMDTEIDESLDPFAAKILFHALTKILGRGCLVIMATKRRLLQLLSRQFIGLYSDNEEIKYFIHTILREPGVPWSDECKEEINL